MEASTGNHQLGEGGDRISVFARVRPLKEGSTPASGLRLTQQAIELAVPRGASEHDGSNSDKFSYHFKEVFGPEAPQNRVFETVAQQHVLRALDGINCAIMAYGQTGSGKTHTMCGGRGNFSRDRGIIPRTLSTIFQAIDDRCDGVHYSVSMSMIEIYKEVGRDLLAKVPGRGADRKLPVVTVSLKGQQSVLIGAKRVALASEDDGLGQYFNGDLNRTVAETPHNLASSRSHCVCTIYIEASDPAAQTLRTSKVQIVDLAGSERLKPMQRGSQDKKSLMKEAVAINLSLHYLSAVISALNDNSKLVPYRNSFLTKLLIDVLGANANASMVMTVDPSEEALPESISTCRFAQRVANIKTFARVNEERDPLLVIAELKRRNAELEAAMKSATGSTSGAEAELDEATVRARIRAFLEDEERSSEGGAALQVGPMPQGAFVAFRIFRDLFWESAAQRASYRPNAAAAAGSAAANKGSAADGTASGHEDRDCESRGSGGDGMGSTHYSEARSTGAFPTNCASNPEFEEELTALRAECRMLRAAVAAHSAPRPVAKERKKPIREAQLEADLWNCQAECKKLKRALAAFAKAEASQGFRSKLSSSRPAPRPRRRATSTGTRNTSQGDADGGTSSIGQMWDSSPATSVPKALQQPVFGSGNGSEDQAPSRQSSLSAPTDTSGQPLGRSSTMPLGGGGAAERTLPRPPSANSQPARASPEPSPAPGPPRETGTSSAWLSATTALTEEELAQCGSDQTAYQVFLARDPRAGDIWQAELQKLHTERRTHLDEAKSLGEELVQVKETMRKAQAALETLKARLLEAETAASVDASAKPRAETLRTLLAGEEPRLNSMLDEKRSKYNSDIGRLKELRRELGHYELRESKLKASVQAEFERWQTVVEERYPLEIAAARAREAAAEEGGGSEVGGDSHDEDHH